MHVPPLSNCYAQSAHWVAPMANAFPHGCKFWGSLGSGIFYVILETLLHMMCGFGEDEGDDGDPTGVPECPLKDQFGDFVLFMEGACKSGLAVAIFATSWEIISMIYAGRLLEYIDGTGVNKGWTGLMGWLFILLTTVMYILGEPLAPTLPPGSSL